MPRKKTKLPGEGGHVMDALVVRQEQTLQEREAEIHRIEALFQFTDTYERLTEESKLEFYHLQQINAVFEKGKSLLRMQAHEGHGGLEKIIEDHHMSRREAFYDMAVAEKIAPYQKQFEEFAKHKLFLISQLNEKEIKTLAEGGEVAGFDLDQAKAMTYRELSAALQEAHNERDEKVTSLESVIKQKEEKINELERELRHQSPLSEKEKAEIAAETKLEKLHFPLYDNINRAYLHFEAALKTIEKARQLEGVTYPQLEKWAKEDYEKLAGLNDLFEQLDEALNYIYVDKGDGDRS
jgi:hypothetical protein